MALFSFVNGEWSPTPKIMESPLITSEALRVLSWNIDYTSPCPKLRIRHAVSYLSTLNPAPSIILFQEILSREMLPELLGHSWVQEEFLVTDIPSRPQSHQDSDSGADDPGFSEYMTLMLINLELHPSIHNIERVDFESPMGRDALVLDLIISPVGVLRVVNTHLESLPEGHRRRKIQIGLISELLHQEDVLAGLVLGDMNVLSQADEMLLLETGLHDAWIVSGQPKEGNTWGYQPPSRFPPGRLDRALFCGEVDVKWKGLIGTGLTYEVNHILDTEREEWEEVGDGMVWVSDHSGIFCEVAMREGYAK
ncbi:Endonuclease/exonuclease/phosphatase [Flagelloscypha sp. PMI_526]|nr:Endonuclease/exonuclease/phosphatase [Flagelloscypha sp. PMI_526]